jgi:hypothetical protein
MLKLLVDIQGEMLENGLETKRVCGCHGKTVNIEQIDVLPADVLP